MHFQTPLLVLLAAATQAISALPVTGDGISMPERADPASFKPEFWGNYREPPAVKAGRIASHNDRVEFEAEQARYQQKQMPVAAPAAAPASQPHISMKGAASGVQAAVRKKNLGAAKGKSVTKRANPNDAGPSSSSAEASRPGFWDDEEEPPEVRMGRVLAQNDAANWREDQASHQRAQANQARPQASQQHPQQGAQRPAAAPAQQGVSHTSMAGAGRAAQASIRFPHVGKKAHSVGKRDQDEEESE